MSEQQTFISDGEEEEEESPVVHPNVNDDSVIRKNLFDEFDVPSKQKPSSETSDREYMKVYLRIRPLSSEEIENKEDQNCVERESSTAVLANAPKESFAFKHSTRAGSEISHRFTFSNVFSEDTTQKAFFDETTLPLVTDFIHGQNCLVFTYGVTNSGKTYTIQGTPKDGGILPRSLDVLFNSIRGKQYEKMNLKPRFCSDVARLDVEAEQKEQMLKNVLLSSLNKETLDLNALLKLEPDSFAESADVSKAHSCADESSLQNTFKSQEGNNEERSALDAEEDISRITDDTTINVDAQGPVKFAVWVSYAEIYNEVIYDLLELCPMGKGKKRTTLRLGDDNNGNPYIKGLREIYVSNADEAYKILKIGQRNQKISSTKLNQCSSRSHCIFNVKVLRVVDVAEPHVARVSRLSFVDLAGSERYSKTQSKGDRLKEAGNINTSLMTLGKCLEYLRHNQRNPNQPLIIPFRESKLTRLFQGFFCGRGRASMVVNVNMCASLFDETFHVLKFSAIAKKITTKVSKPVDLPLPIKKQRVSVPTAASKLPRLSVPWADEAAHTPAPLTENNEGEKSGNEGYCYQQQLVNLVKVLQEKLMEEKRKMQNLEVTIREEVCKEMAEQLVAIETAYSERVRMEVTAVEEKCDRRIELLTQSIKKNRKRARVERIEEDDEEWVPSVFLHAEQVKAQEKERIIKDLNAKIAALRQEVKQSQDTRKEEVETSEVVLELQTKLNDANEQVSELKQMLEEAGEAFTEKEAEIYKLKAALDEEEACTKKQDTALKQLTERLEAKTATDEKEMGRLNGALEAAMLKLAETDKSLEIKDSMIKELVRALEKTREELSREKSYVAQTFNNDEENITLKGQLQEVKAKNAKLEKELLCKEETIKSLRDSADQEKHQTEEGALKERNFEEEMAAEKSEIDRLRKTPDELSEAVKELKIVKQLKCAKDEVIKQASKLDRIKETAVENEESEETAKGVVSEKTESTSQGKDCRGFEMANKVEDRVKRMEAEIRDKSVKLDNVKAESSRKINSLETELKECREEIRKLENQEALKELECQLEESTKALDKKNSQVITKNNAIKRLEISLAEKERLLADLKKLPNEQNQRVKEELKTLRRRVMQADKEVKEMVSAKENVVRELTESQKELHDAMKSLEEAKNDMQKKEEAVQSLQKDLESQRLQNLSLQTKLDCREKESEEKENAVQEAKEELLAVRRTSNSELNEMKELLDTAERKAQLLEEEVFTANEKMAQYQEEVQKYQKEMIPELKFKLEVLEQKLNHSNDKVKEVEVNLERTETELRAQLEKKSKELDVKAKEVSELREALRTQDHEKCQELDKVWQELVSMQSTIEERNRTIDELEAKLRTSGREQDSRTEQIQTLTTKLKAAEEQKSTLEGKLEAMTKKMDLVKSDAGKEEETSFALKQLLEDQDRVMSEQAQALDERQNEVETMLTEIESWKDKCFVTSRDLEKRKLEIVDLQKHANDEKVRLEKQLEELCIQRHAKETNANSRIGKMEEELEKLRNDKIVLDEQLRSRDAEIRKANESKDDIMKTMREALKIAEARKAEYEVKLSTVREQCQNDMKREMDEAVRRAKRDVQRQLEEKANLLAQIKGEEESVENMDARKQGQAKSNDVPAAMVNSAIEPQRTENSSSSETNNPLTNSTKKNLKRASSDLTLAELKNQLSASKKKSKEESDDEFTPSSQRKRNPTRSGTKKPARANSCRSRLKSSAKVDVLSTMEESERPKRDQGTKKKKLFDDIKDTKNSSGEESVKSNEGSENFPPGAPPSSTKKRKLFSQKPTVLQDALSPVRSEGKAESVSAKTNILRQLRTRTIKQ